MNKSAYSGSTGSVLGGTTSDVGDLAVLDDIVVATISGVTMPRPNLHRHVLLLGEDGIVGLEVVLFQVLGSVLGVDLDVELDKVRSRLLEHDG